MGLIKLLMKFIKENHLSFNVIFLIFIFFSTVLSIQINSTEKPNLRHFDVNEIENLIKSYNFKTY